MSLERTVDLKFVCDVCDYEETDVGWDVCREFWVQHPVIPDFDRALADLIAELTGRGWEIEPTPTRNYAVVCDTCVEERDEAIREEEQDAGCPCHDCTRERGEDCDEDCPGCASYDEEARSMFLCHRPDRDGNACGLCRGCVEGSPPGEEAA